MPSSEVFSKWKAGRLHSGSKHGPPVKSHAQAVAIFLSEKRKEGQHGGKYPHRAMGGGLGVFPGTNVPPLPGGVGSQFTGMGMLQMPQGLQQGSPMAAFQHLQQQGAERMGQLDWRHMGQMPPQGLGQQFPGKFGLNPIQPGMRADGGATDLPNPFLDMDYTPKPPSSAPPPSDALKFWQHPSPKVIPIRERADGGNVVPFGPRLIDANWEKFRLNPNYQQNRETNALLHRVLGMDSNVVPMSPGTDDKARGGGLGYQFGGSPTSMGLTPGWIERQEARNISHTGPIISAVGGRTDNHAINVPSGSYVLPAAHVSAMGQGNTLNGMQILTRMFGQPMKLPHGAGPPPMRAPRAMGMSSSGGSRGDGHLGRPVPIMAAGGEFVLSPDQVAKVGGGDVNHGHAVLDRWVQNTHKKYAKTIANLPPPAKT